MSVRAGPRNLSLYEDDRALTARAAPFLQAGLDAGEAVNVVVDQRKWVLLRGLLGPAAERIAYDDRDAFYTAPRRRWLPTTRACVTSCAPERRRCACGPSSRSSPAARVGRADGRFVCEVSDHGPGIEDPLTGYLPPRPGHADGAGVWVARQLTHRLDFLPSPEGLTVRLWA